MLRAGQVFHSLQKARVGGRLRVGAQGMRCGFHGSAACLADPKPTPQAWQTRSFQNRRGAPARPWRSACGRGRPPAGRRARAPRPARPRPRPSRAARPPAVPEAPPRPPWPAPACARADVAQPCSVYAPEPGASDGRSAFSDWGSLATGGDRLTCAVAAHPVLLHATAPLPGAHCRARAAYAAGRHCGAWLRAHPLCASAAAAFAALASASACSARRCAFAASSRCT